MKKTFIKFLVTILALVTALTFAGCSMFIRDNQNVSGGLGPQLPNSQVMSAAVHFETMDASEREENFTRSVAKVSRSAVAITVTSDSAINYGSGVIVDINTKDDEGNIIESENEFYILTCHHLIDSQGQISVAIPDTNGRNAGDINYNTAFTFTGVIDNKIHNDRAITLVGSDKETDVAVLKLDISGNLGGIKSSDIVPAKVCASDYTVELGETVFAIGNPGGGLPGSVSRGIVSYIDRNQTISEVGEMVLLQHDATIDHGSSGGGLFNIYGELIGITNAGSDSLNNIYYAIPYKNLTTETDNGFINVAKQLISSKTETNYGYISGRWQLGITVVERYDNFGATYVAVQSVISGSNSDLAGFKPGDIIVSVSYTDGGEKIENNVSGNNSFAGIVSALKKIYTIGDSFEVRVKRLEGNRYNYKNLTLTLSQQLIFCDTTIN